MKYTFAVLFCNGFSSSIFQKLSLLAKKYTYPLLIFSLFISANVFSQEGMRQVGDRFKQIRSASGSGGADSLRSRDRNEDSVTTTFRYLDSSRIYQLDTIINDFTRRFPIPATHIHLGNTGNATRSLLFSPELNAGFDPGFHALDVYKWTIDKVRFYNTTRPYSEINYLLGSRVEQIIELLHTQNIKPTWNFSFQYRLINGPGFFKSQKVNHNNYQLGSKFQSRNLRYNNYFVVLVNKLQSAENGGIVDTSQISILDNPDFKNRFDIPTQIGGDESFSSNFFSTNIPTGNRYSEFTVLLRQQYDIGKKDSLVTDSTVIPLFYPRLRFEHTFSYENLSYTFLDASHVSRSGIFYTPDSAYYQKNYGYTLLSDTLLLSDKWKILSNNFSIYQFPDAKNLQQFIKIGVALQNISGSLFSGKENFFNSSGQAEYKNKTRNQQWDIEAKGRLFFTGYNAGDFDAHISLQKLLGKKTGYLQIGFDNTSRTPSFVFDNRSSFYLNKTVENFKKENNTHLQASYFLPSFKFRLTGHYYLVTNYTYVTRYYELKQQGALFNLFQLALQKTIKLGKRWNWHADVYFQQVIGNAPVNVPTIYTRNRIGYEGNLGFKNLDIAFGTEIKYRSPYKADSYSPVLGRFFFQDSVTIKNAVPDIAAYLHFKIKRFKAFVRAENLNTARGTQGGGFGFTKNNLVADNYPLPGLQFRLGIFWGFVN